MIALVLRLTGTHSRATKTLDTISSNSKMRPNSLTSSLPAARGRADFYNSQQGQDCLTVPIRKPNKQEFIRVHPSEAYRLTSAALIDLQDERETFLVAPEFVPEPTTQAGWQKST